MIEAEPLNRESAGTVLAAMFVSQKDILAVELHGVAWNSIVPEQTDHAGDFDLKADRLNPVFVGFTQTEFELELGVFHPSVEVETGIVPLFDLDHFSQTLAE